MVRVCSAPNEWTRLDASRTALSAGARAVTWAPLVPAPEEAPRHATYPARRLFAAAVLVASVLVPMAVTPPVTVHAAAVDRPGG